MRTSTARDLSAWGWDALTAGLSPRRVRGWMGAALVLMTVAAYLPAIHSGFIWDDDVYVTGNTALRSLDGLRHIWFVSPTALQSYPLTQYYPLSLSSFWVEYQLWGVHPLGYHLVNVLLHALAAVLLWRLLRQLAVPGVWCAAAVFALHPVHVESVAWVTERKNVLSAVCYLGAFLAYLRFAGFPLGRPPALEPRPFQAGSRRAYGLALFLFVCALLSKTVTCSLPVAIALVLWWQRDRLRLRDLVPLIPMVALGAGMGLVTAWCERHYAGAQGPEWAFSPLERGLIAGRALWFYVWKLCWPARLAFIYPQWEVNVRLWWQYLFPAAALAVMTALWSVRRRTGKGPCAAVAFFSMTLVPALGFFNVYPMRYSFVADHFQYLASIGLIALATATVTAGLARYRMFTHRVVPMAAALVLLTLAAGTWRQSRIYRNEETLWRDTLAKSPSSWMAHNNLGLLLTREGVRDEAAGHFSQLLHSPAESFHADAYMNLGVLLLDQGKVDEAVAHFAESVRLNPTSARAHDDLGIGFAQQGRLLDAMREHREALRLKPDFADAHYNLAVVLARHGEFDAAIAEYHDALRIRPGFPEARNNLGLLLVR